MHYIIETNADGTWKRVYEKVEPVSAERTIYASRKGGKPLNIGVNTEPTALHALNSLKGMLNGLSLSFALTREALS